MMTRSSALLCFSAALFTCTLSHLVVRQAQYMDDAFDPTKRDLTQKCGDMAENARPDKFCNVFNLCCSFDPLNGDKCQNVDRNCEPSDEPDAYPAPGTYYCKMSNCTELITTTTTTTTSSPESRSSFSPKIMFDALLTAVAVWIVNR